MLQRTLFNFPPRKQCTWIKRKLHIHPHPQFLYCGRTWGVKTTLQLNANRRALAAIVRGSKMYTRILFCIHIEALAPSKHLFPSLCRTQLQHHIVLCIPEWRNWAPRCISSKSPRCESTVWIFNERFRVLSMRICVAQSDSYNFYYVREQLGVIKLDERWSIT